MGNLGFFPKLLTYPLNLLGKHGTHGERSFSHSENREMRRGEKLVRSIFYLPELCKIPAYTEHLPH